MGRQPLPEPLRRCPHSKHTYPRPGADFQDLSCRHCSLVGTGSITAHRLARQGTLGNSSGRNTLVPAAGGRLASSPHVQTRRGAGAGLGSSLRTFVGGTACAPRLLRCAQRSPTQDFPCQRAPAGRAGNEVPPCGIGRARTKRGEEGVTLKCL